MREEVRDADERAVQLRAEGMQAGVGLELAPRPLVHLGWLGPLVEVDVAAEQGFPGIPVGRDEPADGDHVAYYRPLRRRKPRPRPGADRA